MSDTVWMRLKFERVSRAAHRVSVRTGAVACGFTADLRGFKPTQIKAFVDEDAGTPRCPKCARIAGAAA